MDGVMPTWNFALVIVQNKEGKFLAVQETRNRGLWIPAGKVEIGETYVWINIYDRIFQ
jgi:hypothetical protein